MGALPKGYTPPRSSGNYMKLQQGSNKFRILSNIIVGWETWLDEGGKRRPVRAEMKEDLPHTEDAPKFFWAMVVYNYGDQQIQILEITQAGIRKPMEELENNEDWGDLRKYDITIRRDGEGKETRYSVIPSPSKELPAEVLEEYKEAKINLEALFTGDNPFEPVERKGEVKIDPKELPF